MQINGVKIKKKSKNLDEIELTAYARMTGA